ncbi:MAG: hypothetical protein IIW53_00660 [Rikenellaceae bacterium]|nr:hypothetical protein [Rikenellaceae bacterium]MBQ5852586.1 hypothetical protein [Rikenellaceae bacterium]
MDMTEGGVYTEYSMSSDATEADLPTDCRTGSFAYRQSDDTLFRLDNNGEWGEVGAE